METQSGGKMNQEIERFGFGMRIHIDETTGRGVYKFSWESDLFLEELFVPELSQR